MFLRILLAIVLMFTCRFGFAQCAIETWSLEKRVDLSTLVVEGKVVDQYPFRENGKTNIYTASIIEVYKVFKGQFNNPYYIEVITYGGQIGLERHHADPELELQKGDMGVFLLTNNKVDLPYAVKNNGKLKFRGVANILSFIAYELDVNTAYDGSETFYGITTELYENLQLLAKRSYTDLRSSGYNPDRLKFRPTAGPVITGLNSTGNSSANAGTGDILTVLGQGFGNQKGNGRIEFVDANYGDGRKFKTPYANDYSVWTDTMIKVRIPSRAGTGGIKVVANDSGSFSTFTSFKINYAHLNVGYTPTGGNPQYYTTDHVNDNNKGGYTFQLNPRFKARSGMVNCFLRSMETWRCGTFMNWEVGRDTNIKVTAPDKVNIVRLTEFTDNTLAVCYSYWSGCYISGTNMEWFVNELDIEVDSVKKWNLTAGNPASDESDLQSVLSHELGHGHQLTHVIANAEMMNFSISKGQIKRTLSTNDLNGGNYVKNKSVNINVCSGPKLVALNSNNCGYAKPVTYFKVNKLVVCQNLPVVFSDTSQGLVKSYVWDFGQDANPATLTGKGPHSVTYSSEGIKTIKLLISNDFGKDSLIKTNYITVLPSKPSAPANLKYSDTACLGVTTLSVDTIANSALLSWKLPAQASAVSSTKNTQSVNWTVPGGPYTFTVKAMNICGSSDTVVGKVLVWDNPTSTFTATENGRIVTFVNNSQFANSYKWLFGDGDSSILTSPVHTYPMGKAYTASLKSTNRCKTVIFNKTVNPFHPADIDKHEFLNRMVYPNPTKDILNLSKDVVYNVLFDAAGKTIMDGRDNTLDLTNRAKGLYILNIHIYSGASYFVKIVKE